MEGKVASYTGYFFGPANSDKIVIKGDPRRRWGYIHYADLAECYLKIVEAPVSTVKGEIFSINDNSRVTIGQVMEKLASIVGKKAQIVYEPAEKDFWGLCCEQNCLCGSEKAERLLGWKAKHWFYENLDIYYEAWKAWNIENKSQI